LADNQDKNANSCLFCGLNGAGVLSKEHVIPQWLLRHLDLPVHDQLFQGVGHSESDRLLQTPRIHSTYNFVQGHVCKDCNTGWMSRLEAVAKPMLIPLIDQDRSIEALSASEKEVLGKWTVKTAYLHGFTSPLNHPPQVSHLQVLFGDKGSPLPGVSVFGMQSDFKKPSGYWITRQWPFFAAVAPSRRVTGESYKIGLQFRHLYLLTAFWPNPNWLLMLAKGIHIPLFSLLQNRWPNYQAEPEVGDGPVDQLALFCNSLAILGP